MKFNITSTILAFALSTTLISAKSCGGGACVQYYHGSDCRAFPAAGEYVPTCKGNCFQFSTFDSLYASGNSVFGTNCHVYSDPNCENEIADTGNQSGGKCVNTPAAQSMKCYYNC
ncbi:hypothetical protein C8R43DRAFT_889902 [Mycena crocata]|nr:hypothetical protein C8R43DRAFT_889902 [Mycena crocata]